MISILHPFVIAHQQYSLLLLFCIISCNGMEPLQGKRQTTSLLVLTWKIGYPIMRLTMPKSLSIVKLEFHPSLQRRHLLGVITLYGVFLICLLYWWLTQKASVGTIDLNITDHVPSWGSAYIDVKDLGLLRTQITTIPVTVGYMNSGWNLLSHQDGTIELPSPPFINDGRVSVSIPLFRYSV